MRKACAALAHLDGKAAFGVFWMRRVEVLLEVCNHAVAWIAVRAQEGVVVADAVQALADLLLRERAAVVLAREGLDGAFFRLDVSLDLAPRAALGVDLLGGDGDEVVAEELERVAFFENAVYGLDGLDA